MDLSIKKRVPPQQLPPPPSYEASRVQILNGADGHQVARSVSGGGNGTSPAGLAAMNNGNIPGAKHFPSQADKYRGNGGATPNGPLNGGTVASNLPNPSNSGMLIVIISLFLFKADFYLKLF